MNNIIVIAYQLHYGKGSECAVAWDYIRHMSRCYNLTVLYGSSGKHHDIGDTAEMEAYTQEHPMHNVTFLPVKPSFKSKNWDYSLRGIRGFYKEYRLWHEDVLKEVSRLLQKGKYDLIHFLGPIGYHEPGRLYQLPLPYIWGPVGGMGTVPVKLLIASDLKYRDGSGFKLIVKTLASQWRLMTNRRVKAAFRNADMVVGATTEYVARIKKAIGKVQFGTAKYYWFLFFSV